MTKPSDPVARKQAEWETDPFRYGWRTVEVVGPDGQPTWKDVPLTIEDVLHPQEEDHFMLNEWHDEDTVYLRGVLHQVVRGRPGVRVFHDMRTDWGVPGLEPMGPDLGVFANVPQVDYCIRTFRVRELETQPLLIVEVTSPSTRHVDLGVKVQMYEQVGVPWYVIVDHGPESDERNVRLLGYRATPAGYVPLELDEKGRLWVEPVGIWLVGGPGKLVCLDKEERPIAGLLEVVETARTAVERVEELESISEEAILERQEAEKRADDEKRQRKVAEQELLQVQERAREEERLRLDAERQRQQAEDRAKDEERQRLDAEKRAKDEERLRQDVEKRLADLEAELRRLRKEENP